MAKRYNAEFFGFGFRQSPEQCWDTTKEADQEQCFSARHNLKNDRIMYRDLSTFNASGEGERQEHSKPCWAQKSHFEHHVGTAHLINVEVDDKGGGNSREVKQMHRLDGEKYTLQAIKKGSTQDRGPNGRAGNTHSQSLAPLPLTYSIKAQAWLFRIVG